MAEVDATKYIAQGLDVMLKQARSALAEENWEALRGLMRQIPDIGDRLIEIKTGKDRWGGKIPSMMSP